MQPLNPGLVNQNFKESSPAADANNAFDQATDLGGDIHGENRGILFESLSMLQRVPHRAHSTWSKRLLEFP
jgi:hypothetical protein